MPRMAIPFETFEPQAAKQQVSGERELWLAVTVTCAWDIVSARTKAKALKAFEWFDSSRNGPGSFRWVCVHLDLNRDYWYGRAKALLQRRLDNGRPIKGEDL